MNSLMNRKSKIIYNHMQESADTTRIRDMDFEETAGVNFAEIVYKYESAMIQFTSWVSFFFEDTLIPLNVSAFVMESPTQIIWNLLIYSLSRNLLLHLFCVIAGKETQLTKDRSMQDVHHWSNDHSEFFTGLPLSSLKQSKRHHHGFNIGIMVGSEATLWSLHIIRTDGSVGFATYGLRLYQETCKGEFYTFVWGTYFRI